MSNLKRDSSDNLWHHENTHVWQNRGFGPLFTLTYVGWMVILFIPSLIVAAISRANLGDTIMALCYYNNPWEVWAYKIGGWRNPFMAWSDPVVISRLGDLLRQRARADGICDHPYLLEPISLLSK